MKIYTRKGDAGETGLLGGGRTVKHDPRVVSYGDVDELNSIIGLVLATDPVTFRKNLLLDIQRKLFAIGGVLASPEPEKVSKALEKAQVDDDDVTDLEEAIDAADAELVPLERFVLPGGCRKSAILNVARTVCRRAERSCSLLTHNSNVDPVVLKYLNRLSDLLFTLARLANHEAGVEEVPW